MIKPCTTVRTPSVSQKQEKLMRNLGTPVHVFQEDFLEKSQFKFLSHMQLFNYCYCFTTAHTECLPGSWVHLNHRL